MIVLIREDISELDGKIRKRRFDGSWKEGEIWCPRLVAVDLLFKCISISLSLTHTPSTYYLYLCENLNSKTLLS